MIKVRVGVGEDGSEIGGSRVHFSSTPVKYLADLRSRANSRCCLLYTSDAADEDISV